MSDERGEHIEERLAETEDPVERAGLLLALERYADALGELEAELPEIEPGSIRHRLAMSGMGIALRGLGRQAEADAAFGALEDGLEAVDEWPLDRDTLRERCAEALEHYEAHRIEEALEILGEMLEPMADLRPLDSVADVLAWALVLTAQSAQVGGDVVAARHLYDEAVRQFGGSRDPYTREILAGALADKAELLDAIGDPDGATEARAERERFLSP